MAIKLFVVPAVRNWHHLKGTTQHLSVDLRVPTYIGLRSIGRYVLYLPPKMYAPSIDHVVVGYIYLFLVTCSHIYSLRFASYEHTLNSAPCCRNQPTGPLLKLCGTGTTLFKIQAQSLLWCVSPVGSTAKVTSQSSNFFSLSPPHKNILSCAYCSLVILN